MTSRRMDTVLWSMEISILPHEEPRRRLREDAVTVLTSKSAPNPVLASGRLLTGACVHAGGRSLLSLSVLDLIYQQPHRSTHSHMPSLHYHTVPTSCVLRGLPSRTAYAIRGAVLSTAMTMCPLVRPSGSHTSGVCVASSCAGK